MFEITLLASSPGWLGTARVAWRGIGCQLNQREDTRAKALSEQRWIGLTGFVLQRIMEECCDCFILVAAIPLDESANAEKVSEDWDLGLLPSIPAVKLDGILQCFVESGAQEIGQGFTVSVWMLVE